MFFPSFKRQWHPLPLVITSSQLVHWHFPKISGQNQSTTLQPGLFLGLSVKPLVLGVKMHLNSIILKWRTSLETSCHFCLHISAVKELKATFCQSRWDSDVLYLVRSFCGRATFMHSSSFRRSSCTHTVKTSKQNKMHKNKKWVKLSLPTRIAHNNKLSKVTYRAIKKLFFYIKVVKYYKTSVKSNLGLGSLPPFLHSFVKIKSWICKRRKRKP